ncbi:hypothetical protein ACR9HG_23770, partial [Enterobacter ludwigii]
VAFGTGLASAGAAMVPRAGKAVARTGRFVGRWQHRLQHAGGRTRRKAFSESLHQSPGTSENIVRIGYHGTSQNNAAKIIESGFTKDLFLTDSYLNANKYALVAADSNSSSPVVLAASANKNDIQNITAVQVKASNSSYVPEVKVDKNSLRFINFDNETDTNAVMDNFFEFWYEKNPNPLERLNSVQLERLQRLGAEAINRENRRAGCFGFLNFFRKR